MRLKYYFFVLLGTCSAAVAQQQQYTLQGNITGITGTGKAFLSFRDGDRKPYDSTLMKDGRFIFTGTMEEPAEATLYIHTDPLPGQPPAAMKSEGTRLMLEPCRLLLAGERLATAKITGGQCQQDYIDFHQAIDRASDSAYQVWKAQLGTLPEDSAASFHRLLYARTAKARQAKLNFVATHPNSYVAYDVFRQSTIYIEHPADIVQIREVLKPAFGEHAQFKAASGRLDLVIKFAIGQPAVNFTQTDNNGKDVSLLDVKGKYVLIDFWASWCGPCRQEYPYLKKAYAQYKSKNFEIIGISLDDKKADWLGAIQANGFQWIQLCDLKGRENVVAKAYGVAAIPQNFLLDPQGRIIAKNLRGNALEAQLAQVMQ